jgi:hypothetical protein
MDNNNFNESKAQFVLSTELLYLLKWLMENDSGKLHKIISKALGAGLHQEIQQLNKIELAEEHFDDMHQNVIEFFVMLESLLAEATRKHVREKAKIQNLLPSADNIDTSVCDRSTVRHSLEKTTSQLDNASPASAQEIFYEEILKQWNPSKKTLCN